MNGGASRGGPGLGSVFGGRASGFVKDVSTLVELQAELAALDSREAARKATAPMALLVSGLAMLVGSLPVALLGAAWLLASALGIHRGWAMLLTASAAMLLAAISAAFGVSGIRASLATFRRSREEWTRNLAWARRTLLPDGPSDPRRDS